uniref:Integrase, catalytic region, zinc finger, CCHC-type, peptidase aspartic, catalytic n=1 Tax=Tanacetum cinerariifolium TaxID=118510 RepID=A0A6L2MB71_TANCI|nr:hypothetical protein [Tanacetum cinerariifolium]
MESLNSNSQERELHHLQQMQDKAKKSCMTSFRLFHSHLKVISINDLKRPGSEGGYERAFASLFVQDVQTFIGTMLLNLDQLEKQLDKEEFQEYSSMAAFWMINKQFQMFIDLQFTWDYNRQITEKYFAEYTEIKVKQFRETLLQRMGNVKKSVAKITCHKRQYDNRMNKRQMQSKEGKVDSSKALDASLVVTECSAIESENNIRPANDQVPFAEVQLTAQHNILANEQQHTKQSEPIYDTYLLKKVDSNTTPDSKDMSHRGGEIDQDAEQFQHVIAARSSRNSQEESYSSDDMAHNHYLEEDRKKTQERNRNSKSSVMHTTSLQITTNGSKQKPMSNNQTSRSLPVSKSSGVTSNSVPLVDHSRNSSSFSDSKHFVCSTCQKCVFNANHDDCIKKFRKEVNSHAKVQSPKSRNNIKPAKRISNVNKPERWISKEYRWIPTRKMFTDSTIKVDSEPPNGSNDDITNSYECDQTLNVSACTLNLSAVSPTPYVPPSKKDYEILFQPLFDEYFNPSPCAVSLDLATVAAPGAVDLAGSPSSTTIDQDVPSASTSPTTQEIQS